MPYGNFNSSIFQLFNSKVIWKQQDRIRLPG
jgi:hypothetical protein